MSALPSASFGMPSSSSVRAIKTPPYFLTSGSTCDIDSSLPFTEFTSGLPAYRRIALSKAAGSDESICSGLLVTA